MKDFVEYNVADRIPAGDDDRKRVTYSRTQNILPGATFTMMQLKHMIPLILGDEPYKTHYFNLDEVFSPEKVRKLADCITVNGEPVVPKDQKINYSNHIDILDKISLELTKGIDPCSSTVLGLVDKDNNPITINWDNSELEPRELPEVPEPKKIGRLKTFLHKLGFYKKEFAAVEEQTARYNEYKESVETRKAYVEKCQKQRDASSLLSSMNDIESSFVAEGGDLSKSDEMLKVTYRDITKDAPVKTTSAVKEQQINAPSLDASR